jgi:hypothetical protein
MCLGLFDGSKDSAASSGDIAARWPMVALSQSVTTW